MSPVARMQKRIWAIQPPNQQAELLARALRVSPLTAQVLINRGVAEVPTGAAFLSPKLTELIAPELMPGVPSAVGRIKQAIEAGEKLTVYGDYDVDGITGVAILWQLLTLLGARVDYYIPHRIEEGYGLNVEAVESIAKDGASLLITVDCGITALDAADAARGLSLDLVITDHHRPGPQLPQAAAIVHPALSPDYPNQSSSGAMVAFKLAWALANEFNRAAKLSPGLRDFMLNATSLAAMGTVADVVDLRGENRVLTSYGLKSLPHCKMNGIQALIETAGLTGQGLDSFDIGFKLAPMLNAAGRMGHARLAVELLTSDSPMRAAHIAQYLKEQNSLRQQCQRKIYKEACELVAARGLSHPDNKTLVLHSEGWHTGVIGIVASRLVDKYYRPTIMLNCENGAAQGSARSIAGFDILQAITACSSHLTSFGGHRLAAGIRMETRRIEQFADDFEAFARHNLADDDAVEKLYVDAAARLKDLGRPVVEELSALAPFGEGNPEPLLATKGVRLCSPPRRVGAKGDHLQIAVTDNTASVRCIGFGMGKFEKRLLETDYFSLAYRPQMNTFAGVTNVQLSLVDIQFD